MFTGLIETVGTIVRMERGRATARISLQGSFPDNDVTLGDSIAINGVCLTVTSRSGEIYSFDISAESLSRTALKGLSAGSPVNLERALSVGSRLGGHIVTGHVDCLANVVEKREAEGNWYFRFSLPVQWSRYLVAKGSVAIDGVSLTINEVNDTGFSVNVIPHTARATTLAALRIGSAVNIEVDIIGKYVERLLSHRSEQAGSPGMAELLAQNGYM